MKLIDADAMDKRIENKQKLGEISLRVGNIVRDILKYAPVVDAKPIRHARWQGVSPFVDTEECSECRYCIQDEELETPYCPWCGAKMDLEDWNAGIDFA